MHPSSAIDTLTTRVSCNLLEGPGPDDDQINVILRAATRACDHRALQPWRYLLIRGEAQDRFGRLMANIYFQHQGLDETSPEWRKMHQKAFRAPLIIAVIVHLSDDEKVPHIEQEYSAAASAQMIMCAAHAIGLGAIWRSGSIMFHPDMHRGLDLSHNEKLVGFIYVGQPKIVKPVPEVDVSRFVREF